MLTFILALCPHLHYHVGPFLINPFLINPFLQGERLHSSRCFRCSCHNRLSNCSIYFLNKLCAKPDKRKAMVIYLPAYPASTIFRNSTIEPADSFSVSLSLCICPGLDRRFKKDWFGTHRACTAQVLSWDQNQNIHQNVCKSNCADINEYDEQ
jgi:hypothetical protein